MAAYRELTRSDLSGVTDKDLKELLLTAVERGATFRHTGTKHLLIKVGGQTITVASTPGDYRGTKNAASLLRKALA